MSIRSTVYVDGRGNPVQALRLGWTGQTTAFNIASSTVTATSFKATGDVVRVVSTVNAHIVWSGVGASVASASAIANTASDMYMPANVVEYAVVNGRYVSAVAATGAVGGVLYVTEVR